MEVFLFLVGVRWYLVVMMFMKFCCMVFWVVGWGWCGFGGFGWGLLKVIVFGDLDLVVIGILFCVGGLGVFV